MAAVLLFLAGWGMVVSVNAPPPSGENSAVDGSGVPGLSGMNGGDTTQSDNNGGETGSNQGSQPAANPDAQPGLFPAPPLPHSENRESVPNSCPDFNAVERTI